MPRGIKYDIRSEEAPHVNITCSDGAVIAFWFTTDVRRRSFERRQTAYREQVRDVVNSRYRGIYIETDELALIDLYTRIEDKERRIEILDVFGVVRELTVKATLSISARIV